LLQENIVRGSDSDVSGPFAAARQIGAWGFPAWFNARYDFFKFKQTMFAGGVRLEKFPALWPATFFPKAYVDIGFVTQHSS
jgi:hypothetical protein